MNEELGRPGSTDERPPRFRLSARSIAIAALIFTGVVAAAWVVSRSTRVLGWLAAAVVVAALLHPIVEALATHMKRVVAVTVVLVTTFALVGGLLWAGINDLRIGLDRLRSAAPDAAGKVEESGSWIGEAARQFGLRDRVEEFLDRLPARLAGGSSGEAVRAAATRGLAIVVTVVLMVFLLSHGPRLVHGALRQIPDDRRREASTALMHAYRRAWAYTVALLVKGVAVGIVTYGVCRALRLPASSVLALVVGVGSIVPYLGVALAGTVVVLLAAGVHGGGTAMLALLAVFGLQALDGIVTARVIQPRTMRVGPAISLAVVLVSTSLYGVGGAAVGLAFAVLAVAIASEGLPDDDRPELEPDRVLP